MIGSDNTRWSHASAAVAAALTLSACGGGGGGSGGDGPGTIRFSGFSELPDDGVTRLEGQAVTGSYRSDFSSGTVDISNISGPDSSTADVTTDDGLGVALRISAPGSGFRFDARQGDEVIDLGGPVYALATDGEDGAFFADEEFFGFEYQSFGAWLTGYGTGSGAFGAGSYGLRSAAADLPTGLTASYDGLGLGWARREDGRAYSTFSEVTVTTNFSWVDIESFDTIAVDVDTGFVDDASELDFFGSGVVSGSGFNVDVSGLGVSGSADGRFYGPDAEEVGGTFQTAGPGGVEYVGAFGGSRSVSIPDAIGPDDIQGLDVLGSD